MKTKKHVSLTLAFVAGLGVSVTLAALLSTQSFSASHLRSSVLLNDVTSDTGLSTDTSSDPSLDTSTDTDDSDMTPDEELQFLDDAQQQVGQLKRDVRTRKTALAKCTRMARGDDQKSSCILGVYEKVSTDMQAICAYRDAFTDAIGTKCDVLGAPIDTEDESLNAEKVVTPLLQKFLKAFSTRFFTASVKEIKDRRTEIEDES